MKVFAVVLGSMLFLAACQSNQNADQAAESEAPQIEQAPTAPEPVRRPARRSEPQAEATLPAVRDGVDPSREVPRLEGESIQPGYGLTNVVDGSSPAAFQQSLELIAMDTSSEQYAQLDSAIRYLRAYSPHAWGGVQNLYKSLDGLSGEEIIQQAQDLNESQGRR